MADLELINPYKEKSIAVVGESTGKYAESFKSIGGARNLGLTHPETQGKVKGYVFSKKRIEEVENILLQIKEGEIKPNEDKPWAKKVAKAPKKVASGNNQEVTYSVRIPKEGDKVTANGTEAKIIKVEKDSSGFQTMFMASDSSGMEYSVALVSGEWVMLPPATTKVTFPKSVTIKIKSKPTAKDE